MDSDYWKKQGFTLIELLVVISIVALLIAIALPALGKASRSAKALRTLAAMQQTMVAYSTYSVDYKESLLYGYTPERLYGKFVEVRLPGVPYALHGEPAKRYPLRLAAYQGDSWEMIYNHTTPPDLSSGYSLSVNPSFGLNSTFVGGDDQFLGFQSDRPRRGGIAVFKQGEVKTPSELIVFAETRSASGGKLSEDGHFRVMPPIRAARQWRASGAEIEPVTSFGMGVPAGRFSDGAAIGFMDGHSEALRPEELDDMRLWSNFAKTKDDPALTR